MITKNEVNGFKSLRDFKLNMKSGLNILVGPNGAGKTNIILKLEIEITDLDIRIGLADRMIENWILADWTRLTGNNNEPTNTDGLNGASVIRQVIGTYSKITDGVELFIKASPTVMYQNSESYREFINCLRGIKCDYINFDR